MIFEGFNKISSELNSPVIIFGSGPAGMSLALDLEKKILIQLFLRLAKNFIVMSLSHNIKVLF